MDQIGSLFGSKYQMPQPAPKQDRRTERGELMRQFMAYLNPERAAKRMPPLSFPRMGKILQQIPTQDLYYLLRVCKDSKNFSARFWWELDPKKHETP